MQYSLIYAIVELLWAIPVIAVGYKFYTIGFKALAEESQYGLFIAIGTTAAVLYSIYNTWQIAEGHFGGSGIPVLWNSRGDYHPHPAR